MDLNQLAKLFIQSFESRDAEAITDFCAESVLFENVASGESIHGKSLLFQMLSEFFKNVTEVSWDVHQIIASDNKIAIERTSHIVFNANKITIRAVAILIIVNAKIKRFSDYFDAATFKNQNRNETW